MKTNEQISLFNEVTIEECAIVSGGAVDVKDLAFGQALGTSSPSGTTTTSNPSSPAPSLTPSQNVSFILGGLVSVSNGVAGTALVTKS